MGEKKVPLLLVQAEVTPSKITTALLVRMILMKLFFRVPASPVSLGGKYPRIMGPRKYIDGPLSWQRPLSALLGMQDGENCMADDESKFAHAFPWQCLLADVDLKNRVH